jgi:hypothetical protein
MKLIETTGVLRLLQPGASLLITDERTLDRIMADPAQPLTPEAVRGHSLESQRHQDTTTSLLDVCRQAQARGATSLSVSYDFFFGGQARTLYPDSPTTLAAFKVIHDVAAEHGLDFIASILSPLDTGPGWARSHPVSGRTMQFTEAAIGPDGRFEASWPLQTQWYNNKGPIRLRLEEVRAYAFDESRIPDTPYYVVDPDQIQDISADAIAEPHPEQETISVNGYGWAPLTVRGRTACGLNRVLLVAVYATPEIDYFDPAAGAYMKSIVDQHAAHGIRYAGFYSDEMHIQFDWDLIEHFGPDTEIRTRYLTDNLAAAYADSYGERFRDLAKHLVYFSYHQHDFLPGAAGQWPSQHVLGPTVRDVRDTYLLRRNYHRLLQRRVVDLCVDAKAHAEQVFGQPMLARAHATWQEAPTCDRFSASQRFQEPWADPVSRYDYSPTYQWSSTIRENMAACADYFEWNEFLSCGGTDHPEGGFLDRCYYGAAFVSGLAVANRSRLGLYGLWGSPQPLLDRLDRVGTAFGLATYEAAGHRLGHNLIQGLTPRQSDVLLLYPLDLNAVEERFGSWMVQYGYGDYLTEEQFDRLYGGLADGRIQVGTRSYRAVTVLYSPLMSVDTLARLAEIVEAGGRVLWCAAPAQGSAAAEAAWQHLFGIAGLDFAHAGVPAGGASVKFCGGLAALPPMDIPSDWLPDHTYPVIPGRAAVVARVRERCVGTWRTTPAGGLAVYCGFRPRDDQSGSQGSDLRTLFDLLLAMGAYAPGSLEAASRPADAPYLMQRSPNGAVTMTAHLRWFDEGDHARMEDWYGTFFRDAARDRAILARLALPPTAIAVDQVIDGHRVAIQADGVVTYRVDDDGHLVGVAAGQLASFELDGRRYDLTDQVVDLVWAPLEPEWLVAEVAAAYAVLCSQTATVNLPLTGQWQAARCGPGLFDVDAAVPVVCSGQTCQLSIDYPDRWYIIWR